MSNQRKIANVFFALTVIAAILFITLPLLLKECIWFSEQFASFLEGLSEEYQSDYIAALGGMIGAFLAITGSVWLQNRITREQSKREKRKYATIVYYDIKMFYNEISEFAISVLSTHVGEKQDDAIKKVHSVLVNADWIKDVAELADIYDKQGRRVDIEIIYQFYGAVLELSRMINNAEMNLPQNLELFESKLKTLGKLEQGRFVPHNKFEEISDKLKLVAELKDTMDGLVQDNGKNEENRILNNKIMSQKRINPIFEVVLYIIVYIVLSELLWSMWSFF